MVTLQTKPPRHGAAPARPHGGATGHGDALRRRAPLQANASTSGRRWIKTNFWFGVIFLIYVTDWADRSMIGALIPSIKREFALTDAQVGVLPGLLYLGLGLLAVPTGILVDRFSRKYMIVILTLIWSSAMWAMGRVSTFSGLLAARLGVGAGEAGYNPAGYALISAWYPERLRGTMIGIFNIAQPLGGGLGIIAAAWVTVHYGWRSAFGVMAAPGFLLALLMLFAPDYKTVKLDADGPHEARATARETLRFIFTNRTLLLIYLAQLPVAFYIMSSAVWGLTFFMRVFHLKEGSASVAGLIITLFASLGPLLSGWLSDRLVRRRPTGRILVALGLIGLLLLFHSIANIGPLMGLSFAGTIIAASLGQFCAAGQWGSLVAAGLDLAPPHYRGTCQSFLPLFQSTSAFGAAAATGAISDHWGLPVALEITLLIGTFAACAILWASLKTYPADYKKQKSLGTFAVATGFDGDGD
jgi:MFS family permease